MQNYFVGIKRLGTSELKVPILDLDQTIKKYAGFPPHLPHPPQSHSPLPTLVHLTSPSTSPPTLSAPHPFAKSQGIRAVFPQNCGSFL